MTKRDLPRPALALLVATLLDSLTLARSGAVAGRPAPPELRAALEGTWQLEEWHVNGQVLKIQGGLAQIVQGWRPVSQVTNDELWTIASIAARRDALFAGHDSGIPPFLLSLETS